jgi:hypothetical protein
MKKGRIEEQMKKGEKHQRGKMIVKIRHLSSSRTSPTGGLEVSCGERGVKRGHLSESGRAPRGGGYIEREASKGACFDNGRHRKGCNACVEGEIWEKCARNQ